MTDVAHNHAMVLSNLADLGEAALPSPVRQLFDATSVGKTVGRSLVTTTVIEAHTPDVLSKTFNIATGGSLEKIVGGQLSEGIARVLEHTPRDFSELLSTLTPNKALVHGRPKHDVSIVRSVARRDRMKGMRDPLPVTTRTKDEFYFSDGPSVFMLDFDPPSQGPVLTKDELLKIVYDVIPGAAEAPHVIRPSASSCIYAESDGRELRGVRGFRIYIFVADGTDITRAGSVLMDRLWLHGYGHIVVSKSGSLLDRATFDGSVFQAERLDFAGGAKCGPGLVQRLPEPEGRNLDAPYLDTRAALPNLSGEEHRRLDELKKTARDLKRVDAKAARERWIEERVGAFAAACDEPDAAKREACIAGFEASCRAALEDSRLFGDFEIALDDGRMVRVGEILDNPDKYHGRKTLDPVERDYDGGRPVGWINVRSGGRPYLLSYAHGPKRYQLIRARKTIRLSTGERADTFAKAMEILRIDGALYERGGFLTRIIGNRTMPVVSEWLLLHLDRTIRFETLSKTKGGEFIPVPQDAPSWLSQRIVKAVGEWGLPNLNAVLDAPTMDPKTGRIIVEDGFDEKSGLYVQLPPNIEPINEHVGEAEAREALKVLWRPFEEFPFADATDEANGRTSRSVFLAALLTAVVRRLLATAPGFLFSATAPGSGKTLLMLCLAALMSGDPPTVTGVAADGAEEELKKNLLASALSASSTLLFDNIAGSFASAAICAFLTSPSYSDRVLGQSVNVAVPTNSLLVLTGNHPVIVGDLNRRLLRCELDPRMESPHKRAYKLDPLDYCREHRLDLVRAALTVLKAWHNEGCPKFTPDRTASFEAWSDTIRQVVIWICRKGWLDVADPVASIDAGFEADPETRKLDALLRAWEAEFGAARQPVKALRPYAESNDTDLFEALDDIGAIERGALNPRRIGRWIEARAGRVIDGRRFVQDGSRSKTIFWRVEVIGERQSG